MKYQHVDDAHALAEAQHAMSLDADVTLPISDRFTYEDGKPYSNHVHVAIAWAGGVLWLDMSDLDDHYCIDVRQFRGDKVAATGVFSIVDGRRTELPDTGVKAHGFPAVFMPILLTDKESPALKEEPKW